MTVTASGAAIAGWTVGWTVSSGQTVSQVWNGTLSASGPTVSVSNAPHNGTLGPSGSTSFGFTATGTPPSTTFTCASR
ncbi:cellulose binding domain-containing protein [Micromonospora echinospora]|uniref:cellulose binding domain-containing protein n=1 Tax=Micromonospora echinospora TaxID=1877 RepID=UPI003A857EF5